MPDWSHIALVIAAYLVGSLSPGYWLAKRRGGVDLREIGSGATGATNAGRILGRRGFRAVVVLDILKGALVGFGVYFGFPEVPLAWQCAASYAVVAGHIWPVWLGFRGGKGVATFYGAWCPLGGAAGFIPAAICMALALALKKPLFRGSFSMAWLAAQSLFPAILWWLWRDAAAAFVSIAMIATLWISHRANIAGYVRKNARSEMPAGR